MKRFVLYLLLMPIVGVLVLEVLRDVIYGYMPLILALQLPGHFLWLVYFNWLVPAQAIAIADQRLRRLGMIAAVGGVSTLVTGFVFYGPPPRGSWQWGTLLPGLAGAIAALLCCLLIDRLNKKCLSKIGSTILDTIRTLRRWPEAS